MICLISCRSGKPEFHQKIECSGGGELIYGTEKEFVELSWQTQHHLFYRTSDEKKVIKISGNVGKLPVAKRYKNMILVENFSEENAHLFNTHWIKKSLITEGEFKNICNTFRKNLEKWPVLKKNIKTLVYGDRNDFHEVFKMAEGFYIFTDSAGSLFITDNPSQKQLTLPAEKRNFNYIGFFDDKGKIHLRKGKIVSGIEKDIFKRDCYRVKFESDGSKPATEGFIQTLWARIIYSSESFSVNSESILKSVDGKGRKIEDVLRTEP